MTGRAARPPLMSADELAAYLGQSPNTLKDWRYRGVGPRWLKVGKWVKYDPRDVDKWLEGQKRKAS